ncbi:MAG: hypothetical protein R3Y60_05085 [bacterium]
MNDNQFIITLENGSEQVCNYLFKFHDEDTNKNYLFFEIVISGIIDVVEFTEEANGEIDLAPVTDEKTREMLSEVLMEFNQSHSCGCGGGCSSHEEEHTCCGGGCSCHDEEEEEHTCCGGCSK